MNKKIIWNLLKFAAVELVCFGFWMMFLGGCYNDGFLDLDMVEAGDPWVKYDFMILCLCPSVMMGCVLSDLIADAIEKRRVKNGDKEQN